MIAGDHVGERLGELVRERPLFLTVAQHRLLRKAAHVHRPFDRLALAAELQASLGPADDGHQAEIHVGRVRPVYLHLADGGVVARFEGREIDEAQVHALLDLVGVLPGEEDASDVRLDDVDRPFAVGRGILEEGADLAFLVVGELGNVSIRQ